MGNRCSDNIRDEIINGERVTELYASPKHNEIVNGICWRVRDYITKTGLPYAVYSNSVALFVGEIMGAYSGDIYLPRIMMVSKSDVDEDGIRKVPLFVCEVTSEKSARYDYNEKLETYRRMGVNEYLLVDMQQGVTLQYLKDMDYVPVVRVITVEISIVTCPGLKIELYPLHNTNQPRKPQTTSVQEAVIVHIAAELEKNLVNTRNNVFKGKLYNWTLSGDIVYAATPDISILSGRKKLKEIASTDTPRFVADVVCDEADLEYAMWMRDIYCAVGVEECWMVECRTGTIKRYLLNDMADAYILHDVIGKDNKAELALLCLTSVKLDYDAVFNG